MVGRDNMEVSNAKDELIKSEIESGNAGISWRYSPVLVNNFTPVEVIFVKITDFDDSE
jgi:hypothetical protein